MKKKKKGRGILKAAFDASMVYNRAVGRTFFKKGSTLDRAGKAMGKHVSDKTKAKISAGWATGLRGGKYKLVNGKKVYK